MQPLDYKKITVSVIVSLVSFLVAYGIDQYYIYGKQLYFLNQIIK